MLIFFNHFVYFFLDEISLFVFLPDSHAHLIARKGVLSPWGSLLYKVRDHNHQLSQAADGSCEHGRPAPVGRPQAKKMDCEGQGEGKSTGQDKRLKGPFSQHLLGTSQVPGAMRETKNERSDESRAGEWRFLEQAGNTSWRGQP